MIDPKLREFATERQAAILAAIDEHGTQRAAAEALGVSHGTVGDSMAA